MLNSSPKMLPIHSPTDKSFPPTRYRSRLQWFLPRKIRNRREHHRLCVGAPQTEIVDVLLHDTHHEVIVSALAPVQLDRHAALREAASQRLHQSRQHGRSFWEPIRGGRFQKVSRLLAVIQSELDQALGHVPIREGHRVLLKCPKAMAGGVLGGSWGGLGGSWEIRGGSSGPE